MNARRTFHASFAVVPQRERMKCGQTLDAIGRAAGPAYEPTLGYLSSSSRVVLQ